MKNLQTALVVIMAGAFLLILQAPRPAHADEPGPAALQPPAADAPQVERFEYWRARGDEAIARLQQAEAELDEARSDVSRMRRRNHPRGEQRRVLQQRLAEAREAYAGARRYFEVELPAEARQSGAPPHWVGKRS